MCLAALTSCVHLSSTLPQADPHLAGAKDRQTSDDVQGRQLPEDWRLAPRGAPPSGCRAKLDHCNTNKAILMLLHGTHRSPAMHAPVDHQLRNT